MLQPDRVKTFDKPLSRLNHVEAVRIFPTYVIIGNKTQFTAFESEKIKKSFCQFYYLKTENFSEEEVILRLEKLRAKTKDLTLVFNVPPESSTSIVNYLTQLEFKNIKFMTYDRFIEDYFSKVFLPSSDGFLEHLQNIQRLTSSQYLFKRIMDYAFSISVALISWPIFIFVALRIKHDSPGPVFFKQTRIGLDGKPFKCYKFRSMNLHGPFNLYTLQQDERIFPFGDFMRKSRLDELPQIWNIFRGEMHLIGPRPEWDILVRDYEKIIPHYQQRHLMRPGISGWAQVNYRYGDCVEDAHQKLMYDLFYLKHWSVKREIAIFIRTIWVVILRKGL